MRGTSVVMSLALAALVTASCGSLHPVAINTGDQCFRCRRTIVETSLAGEFIVGNRLVTKFRTPGCLAKYLADHPDETGTIFVTDYATGKMVSPQMAFFVPVLLDPNTGERDYRAYRQKADADAAAFEAHSVPVDWKAVLEKGRS